MTRRFENCGYLLLGLLYGVIQLREDGLKYGQLLFQVADDQFVVRFSDQKLVGDLQNETDRKQNRVLVIDEEEEIVGRTGKVRNFVRASVETDSDGFQ